MQGGQIFNTSLTKKTILEKLSDEKQISRKNSFWNLHESCILAKPIERKMKLGNYGYVVKSKVVSK